MVLGYAVHIQGREISACLLRTRRLFSVRRCVTKASLHVRAGVNSVQARNKVFVAFLFCTSGGVKGESTWTHKKIHCIIMCASIALVTFFFHSAFIYSRSVVVGSFFLRCVVPECGTDYSGTPSYVFIFLFFHISEGGRQLFFWWSCAYLWF